MPGKNVGNLMEYGPMPKVNQAPKKEQAVIVSIPPAVKKYLNMLVMSNSIIWIAAGFALLVLDGPLNTFTIVALSIAIFWCIFIIPFFVSFITKIDWGQRGG